MHATLRLVHVSAVTRARAKKARLIQVVETRQSRSDRKRWAEERLCRGSQALLGTSTCASYHSGQTR